MLLSQPSGFSFLTLTSGEMHHITTRIDFQPSPLLYAGKLDRFAADIRSFREILRQCVKDIVIPSIQRNFDAGGRPKWVPLAHATVVQKHGNTKPLKRSGTLQRNMGFMSIWTFTRTEAFIADLPDRIWYGKVHQAGAGGAFEHFYDPVIRRHVNLGDTGAIPARPFVMIQPRDRIRIEVAFKRWVAMRIKRHGL